MSESERDLCELVCAIRRNRCDGEFIHKLLVRALILEELLHENRAST